MIREGEMSIDYWTARRVVDAMIKANKEGGPEAEPDWTEPRWRWAWRFMRSFRGAGKSSAYGPLQQQINDDADAHFLRGFLVGWAAREALESEDA
jgi:hypothetical protein